MASNKYKVNRYKFQKVADGTVFTFYVHQPGVEEVQVIAKQTVRVPMTGCEAGKYKYIKYLSTDGKYKFIPFEKVYVLSQSDEQIGTVSRLVTNLETAQGSTENIGAKTLKQLQLSTLVDRKQYEEYSKCLQSSRVYLQNDDTNLNDEEQNWLLVSVTGGSSFSSKKTKVQFTITVTLPEYNNITM